MAYLDECLQGQEQLLTEIKQEYERYRREAEKRFSTADALLQSFCQVKQAVEAIPEYQR